MTQPSEDEAAEALGEEITLRWANLWSAHQDGEPCAECTTAVDAAYIAREQAALAVLAAKLEALVEAARKVYVPCEELFRDGKRGCTAHMTWWPDGSPTCAGASALDRAVEQLGRSA